MSGKAYFEVMEMYDSNIYMTRWEICGGVFQRGCSPFARTVCSTRFRMMSCTGRRIGGVGLCSSLIHFLIRVVSR
jgi:hypothetical protein